MGNRSLKKGAEKGTNEGRAGNKRGAPGTSWEVFQSFQAEVKELVCRKTDIISDAGASLRSRTLASGWVFGQASSSVSGLAGTRPEKQNSQSHNRY